jgi:VanZ family protein
MNQDLLKNKFLILWLPVVLYAGLIFYFSSLEQIALPSIPFVDKILHLAEYSILGFLLARAIKITYQFKDIKKLYSLVIAIAFIYGLSDEFHQSFVPGRTASFWDVISDAAGGLIGAFIYR